jgi:K+-dependent Na+/Ca+ exchanger-like protein
MGLFFPIVLFAIGLVFLIKGGDWFVDGATGIAHRFHIPEVLIGATVVSIGTTLPEVMVSAQGAIAGSGAMAYGNAIGSIICNTSLIAALTIAIRPSTTEKKTLRFPVIFFFCVALFYSLIAYFSPEKGFTRVVGIILLLGFVSYMTVLVIQAFKEMKAQKQVVDKEFIADVLDDEVDDDKQSSKGDFVGFFIVGACMLLAQVVNVLQSLKLGDNLNFFFGEQFLSELWSFVSYFAFGIIGLILVIIGIVKCAVSKGISLLNSNFLFLVIGAAVIAFGANLLVDNGIIIANTLGVPETVITLTFVALGTSLPELVTAITALAKGHSSLSLGNIIGANIFNLVLVSGTAITISPFALPEGKKLFGINSSLVLDIPIMISVMIILTLPAVIKGKLARWQGILLLGIYAAFCAFQFIPM